MKGTTDIDDGASHAYRLLNRHGSEIRARRHGGRRAVGIASAEAGTTVLATL
jgi:hypothetical protein